MLERRKFVRISEQADISYKILPEPKTEMFITRDISQGGIRFFVKEHIPQKSRLEIRLTLKQIPFSFKAVAEVKWIRKDPHSDSYEIGVEFVNIPMEATKHLMQYITSIFKKKYN